MPRLDAVTLCREYMFADTDSFRDKVSPPELDKVLRVRAMYLWLMEKPSATDAEFVAEVCNRFRVSRPTAYADLSVLKTIIPDLSRTAREYQRWKSGDMLLETYRMAKIKGDTRTMEKAATSYIRLFRADDDREQIDLSDITPQPFIPTMDPTVLGIKPMPNLRERKRKLLEQMSREVADIADIQAEEIDLADITGIQDLKPET